MDTAPAEISVKEDTSLFSKLNLFSKLIFDNKLFHCTQSYFPLNSTTLQHTGRAQALGGKTQEHGNGSSTCRD